ncbi:hypothetical protein RRG08_032545 [Elysia crispata]|uniref:Uncharacterized protein n=1 Tax=Elysia crispata TaxID=231223 RepID=A0AAE0ZY62_9GAST|nr:hypothetical protein RRG08_032545 [Elysia crispata]
MIGMSVQVKVFITRRFLSPFSLKLRDSSSVFLAGGIPTGDRLQFGVFGGRYTYRRPTPVRCFWRTVYLPATDSSWVFLAGGIPTGDRYIY